MKLVFSKRAGKADDLVIEHEDGTSQRITCPKQGMIPHEMVHYAVERVFAQRGFLMKLADGEAPAFEMGYEAFAEGVERLVEVMQAEVWSGRVLFVELLSTYEHACASRGHAALTVSEDAIEAIRRQMDRLAAQWDAVPVNGSITLTFRPPT